MYDIVFAKPKKIFITSDINECIAEATSNYEIVPTKIYVRDITISPDCLINSAKITEYGFNSLLKLFGIPISYARKIPKDLLFTTIYRLQQDKSGTEAVILSRSNGEVAAVVKAPYDEIAYSDILTAFSEYSTIKRFALSEELLKITMTFEEIEVQGPTFDDILHVGTFVYNSALKGVGLNVSSGLYRSLCDNSYLMPVMGGVKADYKIEDQMQRLLRFAENIRCYDVDVINRLQLRFASVFSDKSLFDEEVVKYWKSLSRVVGSADADRLIGFDEETRQDLVSTITKRLRRNRRNRLLGKPVNECLSTAVSSYKFLNGITKFAQELPDISMMIATEKIGGQIIQDMILN